MINIVVGILIGAFIAIVIALLFLKKKSSPSNADLESAITRISGEALKNAQEQFLQLAHERLTHQHDAASKDLSHAKETIGAMVSEIRKDLMNTADRTRKSDEARIASFTSVSKELEMQKSVMEQLRASTDDLKRVLSNNQLRGAFGEQVAENLLKMAGFVTGQDYVYNREQENMDTRPDFTLFLPDRTKINIDVKFPYAALMKYTATDDRAEKELHLRQFTADVKQKIKQVASRGYINPEEKTVDFVILFIPNEMIFSFIYDQLNEVWEEAMQKKVIFAGPFSFTAILRMIKQAYSNFRYQENLHAVIGLIQKFEGEYEKFSESLDTLGDRLDSTKKQFDTVSGTRTRVLGKVIDQIKNQNVLPSTDKTSSMLEN